MSYYRSLNDRHHDVSLAERLGPVVISIIVVALILVGFAYGVGEVRGAIESFDPTGPGQSVVDAAAQALAHH